jgi:hypothetical protein
MVMVNGPFESGVVTEASGVNFPVSEFVFAGPDFRAGVSGMAVMSFIISSFWMDVGVVPWSEDVSGVTLQAAWLTERNNTNPRINITRMISDTVFMFVGFLKQL